MTRRCRRPRRAIPAQACRRSLATPSTMPGCALPCATRPMPTRRRRRRSADRSSTKRAPRRSRAREPPIPDRRRRMSHRRPRPHGVIGAVAAFWMWLARPPVAAAFASVMAATLVGVMWWDRPLDETLPSATPPVASVRQSTSTAERSVEKSKFVPSTPAEPAAGSEPSTTSTPSTSSTADTAIGPARSSEASSYRGQARRGRSPARRQATGRANPAVGSEADRQPRCGARARRRGDRRRRRASAVSHADRAGIVGGRPHRCHRPHRPHRLK